MWQVIYGWFDKMHWYT